jgi:transposase InsO family protein
MSENTPIQRSHQQWARLRFSVVGPLLASPPSRGELQARLQELAAQKWRHPISAQWVQFGASTVERWYYLALNEKQDPVAALQRKLRSDLGQHPGLSLPLREALVLQYRQHPNWSYQLHADNLAVLAQQKSELGPAPAYATVLRFMKAQGLFKRRRRGPVNSPGAQAAEQRFESREVRSYENPYVNGLWHLDFHHGSLRVLLERGQWAYPLLLGVLDDHSRLCCHAQWYLSEGAEELCHGLSQALEKRGLPRALLEDNGSAMIAAETEQGLERLGIVAEHTLPFSPYQNGKQEFFWTQIEGRLLPMLEGVADLTLRALNEATLAWVEMEYNRKTHSELGMSPLQAFIQHKDVGRPCPDSQALRLAFTAEWTRTVRRSDGTTNLKTVRLEVPSRYGHFQRVTLRAASWDLSHVYLADPKTGAILCRLYPLDKHKNAEGRRAAKASAVGASAAPVPPPSAPAPLLQKLLKDYATTGLPPAYLPKDEITPTPTDAPNAS